MKEETKKIVETLLFGVGLIVAILLSFTAAIQSFTTGAVLTQMPSFITEQAHYYGLTGCAIGGLFAGIFYVELKKKNSAISKGLISLGGLVGILLAGSQLILAHGDMTQIAIAIMFGYLFFIMLQKGIKR